MENNYNNDLLIEIKNLKESTTSIKGFAKTFETLETIANKHMEINSSFEDNLEHLDEYNQQFSELNNAIRTNILDLKEAALKFPEQLSDIADKNEKAIKNCENNIVAIHNQTIKSFLEKLEIITNYHLCLKKFMIYTMIINIFVLLILVYKVFFVH